MNKIKKILNNIFIDGLSGMALGLFSTLIVGTILSQIAAFIPGHFGNLLLLVGKVASLLTGAGIGCGVAYKFKSSPLVTVSAGVAGLVGAYAKIILSGSILVERSMVVTPPGEPLGAFVAAYIAIIIGNLISGKTKIDIVATPMVSIIAGSSVGLLVGPWIATFMTSVGELVNWGADRKPILMGIIVAVVMGMALTLPISSAAIGVSLNLSGIAAGAACAGCCANMIGFAIASFKDNKVNGLVSQGIGTSMLQIPNIVKKPVIWLPAIISSAVVGPISAVIGMKNNAVGSGMGTSGLVGQLQAYDVMAPEFGTVVTILLILVIHVMLPGIIAYLVSSFLRKKGLIKPGDMRL